MYKYALSVSLLLGVGCNTVVSNMPYEGDNHPFRVAMRDMKTPYKTLENFATDAKLLPEAAKAAQELKVICKSTSEMKPAFLTPEQHADYEKHFSNLVAVIEAHEASFKNGDVKKAQGLHAALEDVKKAAHKQFIKQAKKHRGAE